jgi:hypothetical protein
MKLNSTFFFIFSIYSRPDIKTKLIDDVMIVKCFLYDK